MASELARERAARAWCTFETRDIQKDTRLAEAFANILDEIGSKPWLGNATTEELLNELRARCELNGTLYYKTASHTAEAFKNKEVTVN